MVNHNTEIVSYSDNMILKKCISRGTNEYKKCIHSSISIDYYTDLFAGVWENT